MLKIILGLLFLSTSSCVYADDASAVWGKIVHTEKSIKGVNYKYFVYYVEGDVSHAYPIESGPKEMAQKIEASVGQNVRLVGHVRAVTLKIDGPKKNILVFLPLTIKPLTLSELSINDPVVAYPKEVKPKAEKPGYNGGGIRINDKIANGIIYTGAAIILGTKLGELLTKKR